MKWNLRLTAANHGIWKASELQKMLADAGLVISAGKMSGLWSGCPASIKLEDLDVICAVLGCQVQDLLIPETVTPAAAVLDQKDVPSQAVVSQAAGSRQTRGPQVTPRRRDRRSLPPA